MFRYVWYVLLPLRFCRGAIACEVAVWGCASGDHSWQCVLRTTSSEAALQR